jgi:hypothetical protein
MKIKPVLIGLALLCPVLTAFSQSSFDALRYSQIGINGSARMLGIGGAGSAIGSDISNLSGNPAGLGFFRKSEWSISPSLGFTSASSEYLGNTTAGGKAYFSVPNFGIVFASPTDDLVGGKWRGGAFGISFNRIGNYQNQFTYEGVNNQTSMIDYFVQNANGYYLDELDPVNNKGIGYNQNNSYDPNLALTQIAYFTYLINPIYVKNSQTGLYGYDNTYYASLSSQESLKQKETVNTSGGNFQWNLSYGGNIDNKFYFGVALGITRMRYDVKKTYQETVINTTGVTFREPSSDNKSLVATYYPRWLTDFTFEDNFTATGSGVNISGGFIYRPNDIIRFGASIVSPTRYSMKEEFSQSINANFANVNLSNGDILSNAQDKTGTGNFNYKLLMPWKASGGLAVFFGKNGFVTADVDYIPYDAMKFSNGGSYDFSGNNQAIKNNFKSVINFKAGVEGRFDIYRLRAGFGYYQNPVNKNVDNLDRTQYNVSVGGGIRKDNFYMDAAILHSISQTGYTPYVLPSLTPSVVTKNNPTSLTLTFGSYF